MPTSQSDKATISAPSMQGTRAVVIDPWPGTAASGTRAGRAGISALANSSGAQAGVPRHKRAGTGSATGRWPTAGPSRRQPSCRLRDLEKAAATAGGRRVRRYVSPRRGSSRSIEDAERRQGQTPLRHRPRHRARGGGVQTARARLPVTADGARGRKLQCAATTRLDDVTIGLAGVEQAGRRVLGAGLPDLASCAPSDGALGRPSNVRAGITGTSFTVDELEAAGVRRNQPRHLAI